MKKTNKIVLLLVLIGLITVMKDSLKPGTTFWTSDEMYYDRKSIHEQG